MANEDILVTARIGKLDSKEATLELQKELRKAMGKVKIDFSQQDLNKLSSEFAKIFKKAGTEGAIFMRNAITKELKGILSYTKTGKRTDVIPESVKEWNKTVKYTPKTFSPSGRSGGLIGEAFTEKFSRPLADLAEELGATKSAVKKIRENLPSALSGIKYAKEEGKATGSIELGKGLKANVSFAAAMKKGELIPDADGTIGITGVDYQASSYGKKYFDKAVTAQKLLPGLRQSVSKIDTQMGTLPEGSEKYNNLLKTRLALEKEISKLQKDINKAEKESTAAQKSKLSQIQKTQKVKSEEKDSEKQIKESQKEQNNAYKDSVSLLNQINKLKKQNIQYSDSSQAKALRQTNEEKITTLEKELEVKKKLLTPEDKSRLIAKEQQHFAEQSLKATEKRLKLESTKGSRGNFFDEIKTSLVRVGNFSVAYKFKEVVEKTIIGITNRLTTFDKYMTNLRIVTKSTESETRSLMSSYIALGKSVGASTDKVVEAADIWLRQGRSLSETNDLIKATMVMANISGVESSQAADMLTSAINGFKLEAKDAMHVVDTFAAIDLAAAANTEELAEALQRVSANAGEAGLSIETTTAYIGALVDATRLDAGSIGSALSTIISRFNNIKLNNLTSGEETLSDTQKALNQINVQLFDTNGSFKDFNTVMGEVANKWGELNDVEKSSLAYAVAGTRQRNIFIQLMKNWDKTLYLSATALNSEGEATKKNEIYMDSYAASVERLKSSWDKLVSKNTSNGLKSIVNFGTTLLNLADKLNISLGKILVTSAAIATQVFNKKIINSSLGKAAWKNSISQGAKSDVGKIKGLASKKNRLAQQEILIGSSFEGEFSEQAISQMTKLQQEIVGLGLSSKNTTTLLTKQEDGSVKLLDTNSKLDALARKRLEIYKSQNLTTEQAVAIEKSLTEARAKTGQMSTKEIWQSSTLGGKAVMAGSVAIKAAASAAIAYEVADTIWKAGEAIVGLFAKEVVAPEVEAANKMDAAIDKMTQDGTSATVVKDNLEMLDKIAEQISTSGLDEDMESEISTIIDTLNKGLGVSLDIYDTTEDGVSKIKDLKEIVSKYKETAAEETAESFASKNEDLINSFTETQGNEYQAYGRALSGGDLAEDIFKNVATGAAGGAVVGSALPGIGNAIGAAVGAVGGGVVSLVKWLSGEYDKIVATETGLSLEEAIKKTKANYEAETDASRKSEIKEQLDSLEKTKEKQEEIRNELKEQYESQFQTLVTASDKTKNLSSTDKTMIQQVITGVSEKLTDEQLLDPETFNIFKQGVEDLGTQVKDFGEDADYTSLANSLGQPGTPFYELIKDNETALMTVASVIKSYGPSLSKATAALKESIDKRKEQVDRQIEATEAQSTLLESLASLGGDLDMSKSDILSMLNIGGKTDVSKILDPAFQKYAKELTDLYDEYWGEDGKIANATYLQTQEQLTEEYERAVNLKEKEYEILKKQLEIQESQNELAQAQRERDTLVFRNGRFTYETNPATLQQLKEQQEQLQKEAEQLEIQKNIEEYSNKQLDELSSISQACETMSALLEGDITTKLAEVEDLKEMIDADLEKGGGKLTDPLLIGLFKQFSALSAGLREKLVEAGIFADSEGNALANILPYDTGGLLKGKGLFNKQSVGDEVVLSPTDAPKILSLLSRTSEFQSTVENANSLLRTLGSKNGKPESVLGSLANGTTTIFNVDSVNVEEANDIEGILLSAQQKVQMTNPRFIRG